MTAKTIFRIAAVVFLFCAAGHTYGFLSFKPPTPEGLAAQAAMKNVTFVVGRSTYSFGGFYEGFGLSCSVSMLFTAVLCWQLAALSTTHAKAIAGIAWALFAVQVVSVFLSFRYFGPAPMVLSVVGSVLLGYGAFKLQRSGVM